MNSIPDPTSRELSLVMKNLDERQREMMQNQREIATTLQATAKTLEGVAERLEALEDRVTDRAIALESIHAQVERTRAELVEQNLRIDRIEQASLRNQRIANWIFGGGLIAAIATLGVLVKIASLLPQPTH